MADGTPYSTPHPLIEAVEALVAEYGLPLVYEVVRERDGFCGNCGVPLEEGRIHKPWGSIGSCTIERTT